MNANAAIKELHATWCEVTGQDVKLRAVERLFFELWRAEYSADDLRCVLEHMLRFNRQNSAKFAINPLAVLGDLEKFESLRSEARARERNRRPAPTPRQQAIQDREKVVDPEQASTLEEPPVKSFGDVLKSMGAQGRANRSASAAGEAQSAPGK